MNEYVLSSRAERDLREIYEYIAEDKRSAAGRMMQRFHATFNLLASNSEMGQRRDELLPGIRCLTVVNYVIFFRPFPNGVEIVRVIHGARDIDRLFS
jgi:toxin ParE1/3/4